MTIRLFSEPSIRIRFFFERAQPHYSPSRGHTYSNALPSDCRCWHLLRSQNIDDCCRKIFCNPPTRSTTVQQRWIGVLPFLSQLHIFGGGRVHQVPASSNAASRGAKGAAPGPAFFWGASISESGTLLCAVCN